MNLSKFTFGQLWKLHHQSTLMRVTAAYHGMLERYWRKAGGTGQYFVLAGKLAAPERSVRAWEKLYDFLTGPGLRAALREAAGKAPIRVLPGMWSDLAFCYCSDVGGREAAHARAFAIRFFSNRLGMPVRVSPKADHYVVKVQTDSIGAAVLRYHPGIDWYTLKTWCEQDHSDFTKIFWWVPSDFSGLVNPCLKPIRTPDVAKQVDELLSVFGPPRENENVSAAGA